MNGEVAHIKKLFDEDLQAAHSRQNVDELHVKYLGRNGAVNKLLQELPKAEDKKALGATINELKKHIETALANKQKEFSSSWLDPDFDPTIPGDSPQIGHLHPTTQVIRKINHFFRYLGYSVYEGPEIETNEFNFEKLNLPQDHPARDLADTLYIKEPEVLLRTHTSSVEARALTKETLPLRIVVPGKSYRNESTNATNNSIFYQYEGLAVDRGLSMGDLKGTLEAFVKFLYGPDTVMRFRCKYYPQVEPGAGLDVRCTFCDGAGCQVCKGRGFIEVLGAGMVHPNELTACGVDPAEWSGFAFGMGLDRLVMLEYGINDIRKLYDGSLVFE